MVPPGDGLEFHGTPYYKKIAEARPALDIALRNELKNRPLAGTPVAGPVRELSFVHEGRAFVLFFTRKGNDVGLVTVYDASYQEKIEKKKAELKRIFESGGFQ